MEVVGEGVINGDSMLTETKAGALHDVCKVVVLGKLEGCITLFDNSVRQ